MSFKTPAGEDVRVTWRERLIARLGADAARFMDGEATVLAAMTAVADRGGWQ